METINGFSAHADRKGLMDYVRQTGPKRLKKVLVVHGEEASSLAAADGFRGLGVGRVIEKPAVFNGEIAIRSMMTLSLTFDHRIVDGAPAMTFLRDLARYLAKPMLILA